MTSTWAVPDRPAPVPPFDGDERSSLQGWLDLHRATLQHKCAGLTDEQLRVRPVATSAMSLLGLVRHLTDVERWWFRVNQCGLEISLRYDPDGVDRDFTHLDEPPAEEVFAAYWAEVAACDAAVAHLPLEATFHSRRRHADINLRWVYLHLIEEYARHNGHADLIRELIDGTTDA